MEEIFTFVALWAFFFLLIMGGLWMFGVFDDSDAFSKDCAAKHGVVKTIGDTNYCLIDGRVFKQ